MFVYSCSQTIKTIDLKPFISDGQFYIPVNNIEIPEKSRMLREVDELFLSQLKASMEENLNGAYEPVFLKVKGMENKANFDKSKVTEYQYEVLGGTHNCLAANELAEKYPELKYFQGRYAWIFVGLSDEEALWVATKHNKTGSFRHEMSSRRGTVQYLR